MYLARRLSFYALAACLLAMPLAARAANHDDDRDDHHIRRALLISVDGLHALDLTNYVAAHPQSTLARLSSHAKTYTNASASQPSDSFPGLAALVNSSQDALGIQEIFAGNSLSNKFNSPLVDERTPDIILKVNTGVIFTGGSKDRRARRLE